MHSQHVPIRKSVVGALFVLFGVFVISHVGLSQDAPPRPLLATEYRAGLFFFKNEFMTPVKDNALLPPDKADPVIDENIRLWVADVTSRPVTPLQVDDMGRLYVANGQTADAIALFEKRLNSPHLTTLETLTTLEAAFTAFVDPSKPNHMKIAKQYMRRIDALPDSFASEYSRSHINIGINKYFTRTILAHAYYRYVNPMPDSALKYYKEALQTAPKIRFRERGRGRANLFNDDVLINLGTLLSGQSDGASQIDSVGRYLMRLTETSDPTKQRVASDFKLQLKQGLRLISHLGKTPPDIVGTHWFNTEPPTQPSNALAGAKVLSVADGKVRIFEFGDITCGFCQQALPALDSLYRQNPDGMEAWYVTKTIGFWGVKLVDAAEEANMLKQHYLEDKGLSLKIAVWASPKEETPDGGLLPIPSPTFVQFPILGTPTWVITDGNGRVRHISRGFGDTKMKRLAEVLELVMAERQQLRQTSVN